MERSHHYLPNNLPGYRKALVNLSRQELIDELERLKGRKLVADPGTHYTIDKMTGYVNDRLSELTRLESLREKFQKEPPEPSETRESTATIDEQLAEFLDPEADRRQPINKQPVENLDNESELGSSPGFFKRLFRRRNS